MKLRTFIGLLIALMAIFASQLGYAIDHDTALASGMLFAGIGDIEIKDINDLLEKQGRTFEEFKSANDSRIKALESKGYAPADIVEKVEVLNVDLTKLSKEIGELMKKANRPNLGTGEELNDDQIEHKKAFEKYFRKGIVGNLSELEIKALNTQSDPDGGYLVTKEIETMIDKVVTAEVAMRRMATVQVIGTGKYGKPVVTSGATGGWLGETEEATETTAPKIAMIDVSAEVLYAYPWATNVMLEDGVIDIEQWLTNEVNETFTEKEGEGFITGTGIKKPRGILAYDTVTNANYTWGKLGYIASGAAGAFHTDEGDALINLVHALKRKYRNGASWLMNDLTMASVRKIKDTTDNYIWRPGLEVGISDTLLGYPVEVDDYMPDIAANSFSIAFGNFRAGYLIVDRSGISIIRDQVTKPGYTKFNVSKRVGGGVQKFEAIKLMKFAAS